MYLEISTIDRKKETQETHSSQVSRYRREHEDQETVKWKIHQQTKTPGGL